MHASSRWRGDRGVRLETHKNTRRNRKKGGDLAGAREKKGTGRGRRSVRRPVYKKRLVQSEASNTCNMKVRTSFQLIGNFFFSIFFSQFLSYFFVRNDLIFN